MRHIDSEQRQEKILEAIVESYIETAVPIGSRVIAQRFRWSMSPATIRNVMADLEERGFITHPHTSSGRVPTDKGYRFYVDSLLEPKHLTKDEEAMILAMLSKGDEDFESLLQIVSRSISVITKVAGIVITPRLKRSVFKHIEFISLDSSRILTVLITGSGVVKNSITEFEKDISKSDLLRIAEFLNQELEGMFMGDVKDYLTRKLLQQRDSFYTFLKKAMLIVSAPNLFKVEGRIYFDGAISIMEQPEFNDVSRARLFLRVFEEKKDIMDLFNEDMETEGVKIHIGKENVCKDIQGCSLVTCNYKIKGRTIGALGAIGPTRMEYGKVISAVSYLAEALGKVLDDF